MPRSCKPPNPNDIFDMRYEMTQERKHHCLKPSPKYTTSKEKNLWVIGKKQQLEEFIKNAVGDDPALVYNWQSYWAGYVGQPIVVNRIYVRNNMDKRMTNLRQISGLKPMDGITRRGKLLYATLNGGYIDPKSYHLIVLSTYTPEQVCKVTEFKDYNLDSLKQSYDELKLN